MAITIRDGENIKRYTDYVPSGLARAITLAATPLHLTNFKNADVINYADSNSEVESTHVTWRANMHNQRADGINSVFYIEKLHIMIIDSWVFYDNYLTVTGFPVDDDMCFFHRTTDIEKRLIECNLADRPFGVKYKQVFIDNCRKVYPYLRPFMLFKFPLKEVGWTNVMGIHEKEVQ